MTVGLEGRCSILLSYESRLVLRLPHQLYLPPNAVLLFVQIKTSSRAAFTGRLRRPKVGYPLDVGCPAERAQGLEAQEDGYLGANPW